MRQLDPSAALALFSGGQDSSIALAWAPRFLAAQERLPIHLSLTYDEEPALGLATIFFPLHRVERLFLDEPIGQVESLCQLFERRVGKSVHEFLDLSQVEPAVTTH